MTDSPTPAPASASEPDSPAAPRRRRRIVVVAAALAAVVVAAVAGFVLTGGNGTAATVNGAAIPEAQVTDYVQSLRAARGLEDGAAWRAVAGFVLTGGNGTAATVNGAAIPEAQVTDYVQSLRAARGLEDGAAWRQYLEDTGQSSEGIRDQVLDLMISREVLRQGAADLGIGVTADELADAVQEKRRTYESDAQWQQALAAAGLTEEIYRGEVELDLLSAKVAQALADDPSLARKGRAGQGSKNGAPAEGSAIDEVGDAASVPADALSSGAQDEAAAESARTQAALQWLAAFRANSDITVNDPPAFLPY